MIGSAAITTVFGIVLWANGLVLYAYYNVTVGCDPFSSGLIENLNQLTPYFVTQIMNFPGFLGIYYSSIFSGALSSMSTSYNSTSALLWEDWLRPYLHDKLSNRQVLIVIRCLSIFYKSIFSDTLVYFKLFQVQLLVFLCVL